MRPWFRLALVTIGFTVSSSAYAGFDLSLSITNPGSLNASQLSILQNAVAEAETRWESLITGYAPGISLASVSVQVFPTPSTAFAEAFVNSSVTQAGYSLTTTGLVAINPNTISAFGSWDGSGPTPPNTQFVGVNYIDDLMMHEIGHVLGIGTQWTANQLYVQGSGQYTGTHGVNAYRNEFDSTATFIPVELAGGPSARNVHWDQLMRSSPEEGNPSDPWSLDPRIGIVDSMGRDLGLELMSGALDPDYGEPFVSQTTIYSLRDLGFTVVPEPSGLALSVLSFGVLVRRRRT